MLLTPSTVRLAHREIGRCFPPVHDLRLRVRVPSRYGRRAPAGLRSACSPVCHPAQARPMHGQRSCRPARTLTSMTQYPARNSFDSGNTPSVTGSPLLPARTILASCGQASAPGPDADRYLGHFPHGFQFLMARLAQPTHTPTPTHRSRQRFTYNPHPPPPAPITTLPLARRRPNPNPDNPAAAT